MLSQCWKAFKWLFILTLPITFFPVFEGSLGGILFPIFHNRHITLTTEKYLQNVKTSASDWGVGGSAPSFHQFQDKNNRFHLTRLNSNDWVQKLGFLLPFEYSDINFIIENDIEIDKQASLTALMAPTTSKNLPREQWVFLTGREWYNWEGWNAAFDNLLQHAYTSPRLNNSAFHFAECSSTASFLCNVWNTRSPALLHFLIEDKPLDEADRDPDLSYTMHPSSLLPVTVRIIELGLQEAHTFLPWTTFPTQEKQLLSIIAKEGMYQQFEPYTSPMDLIFLRFNEYMDGILDAKGTVLNDINELDWWMMRNVIQPLGLDPLTTFLHGMSFEFATVISLLIDTSIVKPIQYLVGEFLGTPKPGDIMFAGMEEEVVTDDDDDDDDGLGDLFGFKDMFRQLSAEVEKASSRAGRTAAGGTSAPPPETTREGRAVKL